MSRATDLFLSSFHRLQQGMERVRGALPVTNRSGDAIAGAEFAHGERPVLLLPGPAARRDCAVLEAHLKADGFFVWTLACGGPGALIRREGIEELADQVRTEVERLYARFQLGRMAIVGYDVGGLIGRYYVKRLGGDRRCRALVTLGTPHHGTPAAQLTTLRLVSKQIRQMAPMSPFIRRLKLGPFPGQVRFTSIYSKADRVHAFPSCILEIDGQSNLFNVEIFANDRRDLLVRKDLYERILHELREGFGDDAPDQG